MLKIDMHVHTRYSDSSASVDEVLAVAQSRGLDGLAITDHQTLEGAYEALKKKGTLIIIPGEEIKTAQGEILALGIRKTIPEDLPMTETLQRIHAQQGLAILPHPTVPLFGRAKEGTLKNLQIDGLEAISAITPLPQHFLRKNLELAKRLRVPVTAGSDSHFAKTVGDAYTIVYTESRNVGGILRAVKLGYTSIGGGPSRFAFKLGIVGRLLIRLPLSPFMSRRNPSNLDQPFLAYTS